MSQGIRLLAPDESTQRINPSPIPARFADRAHDEGLPSGWGEYKGGVAECQHEIGAGDITLTSVLDCVPATDQ